MKKQKGFTLIELLAIIVILAIIAVITVPIILNIIDKATEGAIKDSAMGYKESVQQHYISNLVTNQNEQAPSGIKTVSEIKTSGLTVSGKEPTDGWVKLEKGKVIDYSLKFDEYIANYNPETNTITTEKNGEIKEIALIKFYRKVNGTNQEISKTELQTGDRIYLQKGATIEKFIVILNDSKAPSGTIALLAENDLNPNTGLQAAANQTFPVKFANEQYWVSEAQDIYNPEKNTKTGNTYSVAYHVETYLNKLRDLGFPEVKSGRIPYKNEVDAGGLMQDYTVNGANYWTASASTGVMVWYVAKEYTTPQTMGITYQSTARPGVRPIIYIEL